MLSGVSDQFEFLPCAILFNGVRISRFPRDSDVGVVVVVVDDVVIDAVRVPPACRNGFV